MKIITEREELVDSPIFIYTLLFDVEEICCAPHYTDQFHWEMGFAPHANKGLRNDLFPDPHQLQCSSF